MDGGRGRGRDHRGDPRANQVKGLSGGETETSPGAASGVSGCSTNYSGKEQEEEKETLLPTTLTILKTKLSAIFVLW